MLESLDLEGERTTLLEELAEATLAGTRKDYVAELATVPPSAPVVALMVNKLLRPFVMLVVWRATAPAKSSLIAVSVVSLVA